MVAKENHISYNFESEIDLQKLNGFDIHELFASVLDNISVERRITTVNEIIKSNNKFDC